MCAWPGVALLHQRAQCGGCRVENVHLVLGHDFPKTAKIRVVRHALVHHRDGAVGHRAVDDVGVAGDPADVGRAPVDVAGVVVENIMMRGGGVGEVAAGGVKYALRFAGAAGGVQDEKRILGVHRFGGANGVGGIAGLVPPNVAPVGHVHLGAGSLDDENLIDGRRAFDGLVGVGLHRDIELGAAHAGVLRDDGLALGVVDASHEAVRAERAEHDRVDSADPRAGEHGDGQLRDHLHVDANAVAFFDAQILQRIGGLLHLDLQLRVGVSAAFVRVVAFPNERGVVALAIVYVAVDAVVAGVELAADEPLNLRLVIVPFAERVPFFKPVQALGVLRPKPFRVVDRSVVKFAVLLEGGDVCVGRSLGAGRVGFGFGVFAHGSNRVGEFMEAKRRVNAGACDRKTENPSAAESA